MLVDQVATFTLSYDGAEAVDAAARAAILDGLGCLVGGTREELGRIVHGYAETLAVSGGPSVVIASARRCPPAAAAYVNATAGHSLCYDDSSATMMGHPTIVILPAVLALGELVGASGREALSAFAVGTEVAVRLSEPMAPVHYQRGWHAMSTCGVLGAAAAAARLLGLDERATRHALGIAATTAAGLRANFGTMAMIYHAGLAARGGVDAALLAREGMTSARDPFSGDRGYFAVLAGTEVAAAIDPDRVAARLGAPFDLVDPGLDVKPYPCGALSHRAVQGVLELRAEHGFTTGDVESVECALPELHSQVLVNRVPEDVLGCRISLTYPVAAALRNGSCGLEDFSRELMADAQIAGLIARIRQRPTSLDARTGAEAWGAPAEVAIVLRDGRTLARRVERLRGTAQAPLSEPELREKFDACCARVLDRDRADRIHRLAGELDALGDVRELTQLLTLEDAPEGSLRP